jgi:glycine oxidase
MSSSPDVIVIGGGIIGLAAAWRARQRGMTVTLLERGHTGQGASRVAAGMLAPVAEVEYGAAARCVLDLGLRSAQMWPAFARELTEVTDTVVEPLQSGTLMIARDEDEARELERRIEFRDSLGLETVRLRPSEAREREPALAPTMRLALEVPEDHSIDPRRVLTALRAACESAVMLASDDGEILPAGRVLVATGAWTVELGGLPAAAQMPVRPVKGQLLRLRDPAGPGLLRRNVRYEGGYLVPRADGRYILGGTVEERGFDLTRSVLAVREMLRDAREAVPGVDELEIEELSVGLRPGTPDNAPMIGQGALGQLIWATGHYRNGILLAPLTAALVTELLAEEPADELLSACSPLRFTPGLSQSSAGDAPTQRVGLS